MDVDSLGKLLVEEIEKYKKAMGIAVKEEQDEDAVKDKTDKEITEMKKEPMEKRKLPMPTWQSKKPKNDDPKDSLAPPPPPPTTTRRTDVGIEVETSINLPYCWPTWSWGTGQKCGACTECISTAFNISFVVGFCL